MGGNGEAGRTRRYRMRKRREDVEATRRRIVEAAVRLHGTVGPAGTTISAVADAAGVQRSTVYRHFEDEAALFGACTSHWLAKHPWPRPEDWAALVDPEERLARGLRDVYGYYDRNRDMLNNSYRDIERMPAFVGEYMRARVEAMRDALLERWRVRSAVRAELRVAVGLALDFRVWLALSDAGLTPAAAADLTTRMVAGLAAPRTR